MPRPTITALSGWAGFPVAQTQLIPLDHPALLKSIGGPHALRGNGRAYGDAAQLDGGVTISALPQDRFLAFDREKGVLRAEAGVTIADVLAVTVPAGWFLPVVPGTRWPTLGGCVASDVHGKNHASAGNFSRWVRALTLVLADGTELVCSAAESPELFWATCGGMGLTGYVRAVTVQLERIRSDQLEAQTEICADLATCLAALTRDNHAFPHAAAWLDGFGTGTRLGRGAVLRGRHARPAADFTGDLERKLRSAGNDLRKESRFVVSRGTPDSFPKASTIRGFNAIYLARQGQKPRAGFASIASFFFPLDIFGHWNRLYGPRGFVQYQCVLPTVAAHEGFAEMLTRLQSADAPPFLAVLKRTGAEAGPLSFPLPGFSLALDFPRTNPRLPDVLDEIDKRIAALGGRVYLAKDSRMRPEVFASMYPRLGEWLAIKRRVDPENRFQTDLGRRLRLCA